MSEAQLAIVGGAQAGEAFVGAERVAAGRNEIDDAVEASRGRGGHRAERIGLRRRGRRRRKGPSRPCRGHAGPARRARRCDRRWHPVRRPRQLPARPGIPSTSKRLAGTSRAFDGSSRRWLARPMRWMRRLAPFGAPMLTTRSTSPQSMPRSSVEVATTALSAPAAMAASTLRRCSADERAVMQRDRQGVVVDAPEFLEHQFGLHARVDEDER